MSHPLALPTVTAALRREVLAAAAGAAAGANVRIGPPTAKLADETAPLVNLHLYRVTPNAANANTHLPSRTGGGAERGPARLALDLSYVMTFYGNAEQFEPERMLSAVALALEDRPVLSPATIAAAIADAQPVLDESDLADALARVRITRDTLSIDDFSKIWSVFYQVPHALSLLYTAAHVRIETRSPARAALPVTLRAVFAAPLSDLRIDTVSGAPEPPAPVLWDAAMVIAGRGLARPDLTATLGGLPFDLSGAAQTADRIEVMLEATRLGGQILAAGAHPLRLSGPLPAGAPEVARPRSNTALVTLLPLVLPGAVTVDVDNGDTIDGHLDLTVTPPLHSGQMARLLLDSRDPNAPAQIVLAVDAPAAGTPPATALNVAFAGLPKGSYLVRLEVDGYLSPVTLGADPQAPDHGQITGPEVTLP